MLPKKAESPMLYSDAASRQLGTIADNHII